MKPRKITIGDSIQLYCGNCLDIMLTLAPVDHIISDPPYDDRTHREHRRTILPRTDGGAQRKALTFTGIDTVRIAFLKNVSRIDLGWLLLFSNGEQIGAWQYDIDAAGIKYKLACIWVKPDSTPKMNGQSPAIAHEHIITAWAGHGHSRWNGGGARGVYTHPTNGHRYSKHPTEKPLSLMMELIKLFTNPNETVLDPFMGSGTTGHACMMMGRKFIGIEQNPEYFDVAVKRLTQCHQAGDLFRPATPRRRVKHSSLFRK